MPSSRAISSWPNAKEWLRANPTATAPWDQKGFKLPSNKVHSPAGMQIWPPANAIYRRETNDKLPGRPRHPLRGL